MKLQHISNKKIVVVSLLSFSSGLIFLGNSNIVHADEVNSNATSDTEINSTNDVSNNTVESGTGDSNSGADDSNTSSDSGVVSQASSITATESDTESNQAVSSDQVSDDVPSTQTAAAQTSTESSTTTDSSDNTSLDIPADTAADHQGKLSGDNGSEWYLDNKGTLYIGAGTVSNPTFDDTTSSDDPNASYVWANYKYADDITNVFFEDGAVAGPSLKRYFSGMSKLANVDVSKLDVSDTTDFSDMFSNTESLDSLDISKWKLATGVNFSSFVSGSGIKHLNLSGLTFTNANLNNAFGFDDNLEDIDLDKFSATGVTNAYILFENDSSLKSLDLTGFSIPSGVKIDGMLGELTSLTSLKVNSDTVLSGTDLGASTGYKKWTDGTNTYSPDDLMAVYDKDDNSSDPSARISTTWTPAESTKVNYTINYYDNGSLVGSISDTGVEGQKIDLTPNYPGYDTYIVGTQYINLATDNPVQVFNFNLNPHETYPVTVTESDGSKLLSSQLIQTIYNDDENNKIKIQNVKDNLITDRTLDLDNTTVEFTFNNLNISGKLSDKFEEFTIGQLFNVIVSGQLADFPADTTREQLIDYALTLADTTLSPVTLGLVYQPVSTDNNPSSNNSDSSNSTVLKNQNIATTTKAVKLYGADGKLVTNRGLDINTAWKSDAEYNFDGVKYYRVSTDEYVKASDVYVYTDNIAKVKVHDDQKGDLVDYLGADLDRKLGAGSEWKTDRIAYINGQEYYRVSTDEFLPIDEAFEY